MDMVSKQTDRASDGIKSLAKVVRVLEAFSTQNRSLSLMELCRLASLPKSTAHRLLSSMRDLGLLDQEEQRDHYRLGMKLFELGNTVLANMELHREARPFVDALTRQGGQAVHLAVFDGRRAIVIHRADASPEKTPSPTVIEQAPVHCTSVGKAILAFQPDAVVERIVAAGLERFTDSTITDPAALKRELEVTRERGYAVDEAEHQPGLRCVGAPIRSRSGRVLAGISITGPAWRLPLAEIEGMAKLVMHHARGISAALGYRCPAA